MSRRAVLVPFLVVALTLLPWPVSAQAAAGGGFRPGAPGIGDPYFPLDGNGGYDVRHYLLDVRYTPDTDVLAGVATITARATHDLSAFNLDLEGLTVRSVTVDGRPATWQRDGGELTVTPRRGLRRGHTFRTVVRYDGVPQPIDDLNLGRSGFLHTDDGVVVIGEPDVAATWFPVNDHPVDKAAYTTRITVPSGLEAVSNGVLSHRRTRDDWTTWTWDTTAPMASYLATATVGQFDLRSYRAGGIAYWDAYDPDLLAPIANPRTGSRFAVAQVADTSYKRLSRTIDVPAGGARLEFWLDRDIEPSWDQFFVEAHTVGRDDWTTLPDLNGHTSTDTGDVGVCAYLQDLHPFLAHYRTPGPIGDCTPTGSTGTWAAASGRSNGYEQWAVDLSAYAGSTVEVSLSYVTDDISSLPGAFVDDVTVSAGAGTTSLPGSTSFEADGDTMDGWSVAGPPPGSAPNPNDWISGTTADLPPPPGKNAEQALARQPEIIEFLSGVFGPYPFATAGGIVDDTELFGFALENQTRPIYAKSFFATPASGAGVVVHELAHQWYGDSVSVQRWSDIWLNEGFATYAGWLWAEREGIATAQESFDLAYAEPAESESWQLRIGDPGPNHLFDSAIYGRGAMTLHQLRTTVGDTAFYRILRTWASSRAGGNATTADFIAHAERVSGHDLDALFTAWLFTATKPAVPGAKVAEPGSRVGPAPRSGAGLPGVPLRRPLPPR